MPLPINILKFLSFASRCRRASTRLFVGESSTAAGAFLQLLDQLDCHLEELDATAGAVERRFMETGSHFGEQVLLNGKLVSKSEELVILTSGSEGEGNVLEKAGVTVRDTLDFVEQSARRAHALISQLDRYEQQIESVQKGRTQFVRTLVPLQIIERLFRIESASLPPDMQTAFASLTQEIATLHGQMRQTLAQQFDALASTRERISLAKARFRRHAMRLGERVATTRAGVASAMDSLDQRLAETRQRDLRLADIARKMAEETSAVMVGLQFQDAMRQKADHVKDSLLELRDQHAVRKGRLRPTLQTAQRCRLEAGQLRSISDGLDRAAKDIASGIQQIFDRLREIELDCLSVAELDDSLTSARSLSDTLLETLQEGRLLVSESLEGIQQTFEAIDTFGGIATNVTSTLRRLALDIRLIALNAQIKAAQVGTGTGLEVLSERTCDLSEETSRFTKQIGVELDALVELLEAVVVECGSLKEESEERLAFLKTEGSKEEGQLIAYRSTMVSSLEELAVLLERSRSNAGRMLQSSDFSDITRDAIEELHDLLSRVGELATASRRASGKAASADRHLAFEELAKRYTMDSERAIHAAILAGTTAPELGERPVHDVEFFSEATPESDPLPTSAAIKRDAGSNIELF